MLRGDAGIHPGGAPAEVAVILGNKQERRFRTDDYFFYYRELKKTFVAFQEGFSREVPPFITGNEDFGRWEKRVRAELTEQDHLSQVANITSGQIVKLQAAEVKTRAALAARTEPVRKMAEATVARLRTQAQLQIQSEGKEKPDYLVVPPDEVNQRRGLQLLPPAASGDVFFDIEGYPLYEQGLEYLLGVVYHEGDGFKYRDWWAHDRKQEQLSFESFVSWAHARWQANPSLHIYHYASYETAALQRLIRVHHYGCGDKLDDLLRNEVFVDLYKIVRQSMLVGEPRYSIKNIEHLYREKRSGEVTTAGGSVVEYRRWLDSKQGPTPGSSAILASIRDYNAEDCDPRPSLQTGSANCRSSTTLDIFRLRIFRTAKSKATNQPKQKFSRPNFSARFPISSRFRRKTNSNSFLRTYCSSTNVKRSPSGGPSLIGQNRPRRS